MLILGIILFGLMVGALAQYALGTGGSRVDWSLAMMAGLGGSFVGGLLASVIAGDGLAFRPSGLIGSFVGAVIVTGVVRWYRARQS